MTGATTMPGSVPGGDEEPRPECRLIELLEDVRDGRARSSVLARMPVTVIEKMSTSGGRAPRGATSRAAGVAGTVEDGGGGAGSLTAFPDRCVGRQPRRRQAST